MLTDWIWGGGEERGVKKDSEVPGLGQGIQDVVASLLKGPRLPPDIYTLV